MPESLRGKSTTLPSAEFVVSIDLSGSTTHDPAFLSVEVRGVWPDHWDAQRLRAAAAQWAGVPIEQIGDPVLRVDLTGAECECENRERERYMGHDDELHCEQCDGLWPERDA